jgi:hypothetical protein
MNTTAKPKATPVQSVIREIACKHLQNVRPNYSDKTKTGRKFSWEYGDGQSWHHPKLKEINQKTIMMITNDIAAAFPNVSVEYEIGGYDGNNNTNKFTIRIHDLAS